MREEYLYDLNILHAKNMQMQSMKNKYPSLEICTDYFDYHNNVCPGCQNELKIYNMTIKRIGAISLFIYTAEKKIYLYAVCKDCSKSLHRPGNFSASSSIAKSIEDYILATLTE